MMVTQSKAIEALLSKTEKEKQTNFQRITSSPEALADFMVCCADCNNCPNEKSVCQYKYENCKETWVEWLKQESE